MTGDYKIIIETIEKAFKDVVFPGEGHRSLYQAEAWDCYEEIDQSKDHKGYWRGLPPEHLIQCDAAWFYLCGVGMQYYLPSMMVNILEKKVFFNQFELVRSKFFFAIDNPFDEQFNQLTLDQKNAVLMFLQYIDPGKSALVERWKKAV